MREVFVGGEVNLQSMKTRIPDGFWAEVLQILNDIFDSLTPQVPETNAEATFSPK